MEIGSGGGAVTASERADQGDVEGQRPGVQVGHRAAAGQHPLLGEEYGRIGGQPALVAQGGDPERVLAGRQGGAGMGGLGLGGGGGGPPRGRRGGRRGGGGGGAGPPRRGGPPRRRGRRPAAARR